MKRFFRTRVSLTRNCGSGTVAGYVDAEIFPAGTSGTVWGWRLFRSTNDTGSTLVTPYLTEWTGKGGAVPGDDVQISEMPQISSMTADGKTAGDTLDLGEDRRIFGDGLRAICALTTTGAGRVHLSVIVWGEVEAC